MVKDNINKNFEKMKAEMMKKKEIAKVREEKNEESILISDNDRNESKDIINTNVNEIKNVNMDVCDNADTSITKNKIVIKKARKPQPPKRTTYYLNTDTIKKIDKYSKLTGMGKSELVQTLLDIALNNLEIEN